MRKDKGLNGDLDRLPMLTWIMFLKFLDDMEQMREEEAKLCRQEVPARHRAALPLARLGRQARRHHRRRTDRVHQQEKPSAPTARRARPVSPTCAALQGANGGDRRDVIATVFKGTVNRMINGYLLRDVINKVNGIHFTSQRRDPHPRRISTSRCSRRCATRPATPASSTRRVAVVRFMVDVIDPQARRD